MTRIRAFASALLCACLVANATAAEPKWARSHEPASVATDARDNVVFIGDSMTAATSWTTQFLTMTRGGVPENHNAAHSGWTAVQLEAARVAEVMPLYNASATTNVASVWMGTNDLSLGTRDGTQTYAVVRDYCLALKAAGFRVLVWTTMPRNNASDPTFFETERAVLNGLLRTNWATFADAIVDIAGDARFGVAGANLNTIFFGDGVHINDVGSYYAALMAVGQYHQLKRSLALAISWDQCEYRMAA